MAASKSLFIMALMAALTVFVYASIQESEANNDPCLLSVSSQVITFGKKAPRYDGLAMNRWKVKSVSMMRDCLGSIAFNKADALTTISTIQEYLHLYPFLDINRNSGAPYNLSVSTDEDFKDLEHKITNSSTPAFSSSYDFHVAVREIIRKARDGHFHYALPKGFGGHFVMQPLSLSAEIDSKDSKALRFFVKEDASLGVHDYFFPSSKSLASYANFEVVSIDGIPTFDYLNSLASKYPMGKDDGVNFNYWLFHALVYRGSILPEANSLTYEFASPISNSTDTLSVNYLVFDTNQGVARRMANNRPKSYSCRSRKRSLGDAEEVEDDDVETISQMQHNHHKLTDDDWHPNAPLHNALKQRRFIETLLQQHTNNTLIREAYMYGAIEGSHSSFKTIFADSSSGYAIMTYKSKYLIVQLRSFLPGSKSDGFWGSPLNWMMANAHNYDRVIIDISDNVGGLVCLGQALTSLLADTKVTDVHDIRRTDLFDKYVPQMPIKTFKGSTNYLRSLYFNGSPRHIERGGSKGAYTQPFTMYCDDIFKNLQDAKPRQPIPREKIIIVTNGVSISTASVFAKSAWAIGFRFMTYGGLPNAPMSISFSIGNPVVVDSNSLNSIFACSGQSKRFPRFPNSAQLGFPFAEAYEFNDAYAAALPLEKCRVAEFVQNLASHHFNHWDDNEPSKIYDAAIEFMDKSE